MWHVIFIDHVKSAHNSLHIDKVGIHYHLAGLFNLSFQVFDLLFEGLLAVVVLHLGFGDAVKLGLG